MRILFILLLAISLCRSSIYAQCGAATFQGTITPTPTSQNTPTLNTGRPYWEFAATAGCSYTFSTCSSAGDTYLRLYNNSWVLQAENDDDCSVRSTINWTCPTTGTYRILLTNWTCNVLAQNTFVSYVRACPSDPPLNDNCSGATTIALNECVTTPFVLPSTATNSGVSVPTCLQPNGSGCGIGSIVEDIWYKFTANSSQTVVEAVNNDRHMAVQVYSGTCGALVPVPGGCSDICASPATEVVTIGTTVGQTYYVRLMRTNGSGTNDMSGTIRVYSSSSHANQGVFGTVLANNSRGSAPILTLNGAPNSCGDVGTLRTGRIQVRNLGAATTDNQIASQSCFTSTQTVPSTIYRNVWARITIPPGSGINGLYFYSTTEGVCPQPNSSTNLRSGFINVYTGTSSCTPVSPCGGTWDNFITSYNISPPFIETLGTERIDVVPGQTYYIEIYTTTAATDPNFNFDVHVVPLGTPPVNENCNSAIPFAGSGVGCNLGADPACTGYTVPCMFTVENSVFYTYESPGTPFQIEVESVQCEGGAQDLQAGIFEITSPTCLSNLASGNLVASACFTGNYTFNINSPLPAGSDYLIWFDGNAGAACTWGYTVLPIELVEFSADAKEDHVELKWTTATETNNDYFLIERSTDGKSWERIHTTDAVGNSTELNYYGTIDMEPKVGISYYRLKQVDMDGEFSYSPVRSVSFTLDHMYGKPIPNPATEHIHIIGQKAGDQVSIYSLSGQLVLDRICSYDLEPIHIDFQSGIYLVSLNNGQYSKLKIE